MSNAHAIIQSNFSDWRAFAPNIDIRIKESSATELGAIILSVVQTLAGEIDRYAGATIYDIII